MGSHSGWPYLEYCEDCKGMHPVKDRPEIQKRWTKIAELPVSESPWMCVRYKGELIFACEDWAPRVLKKDGRWGVIKCHLPSKFRG